jgi:hypothetical protein
MFEYASSLSKNPELHIKIKRGATARAVAPHPPELALL